ncbi:MAG: hypothetical protein ACKOTA_06685, partial [Solirubrobacterales bacterium]
SAPGRTAAGGLAALTALVGLSILWAPIAATAQADLQRLLLYLGALVAGIALLRGRMGLRTVEPALGAGVLLVIVYALADRLLPGLVSQEASRSAAGRLEQPLTYWNAMGALAAVGLVIALRVAGDGTRERWLALAGAAAAVPLAVGVYLSFSRGALLALLLGVLVLVVGSADRTQLRVIGSSAVAGVLACVAAGLLPAVRALEGAQSSRELQGAVMLLVLVALMSASAFAAARLRSAAAAGSFRVPAVAAGALAVVLVGGLLVVASGSGSQDGQPRVGADTRRLASFESNRYEYWKVAGGMFVGHPLAGEGSLQRPNCREEPGGDAGQHPGNGARSDHAQLRAVGRRNDEDEDPEQERQQRPAREAQVDPDGQGNGRRRAGQRQPPLARAVPG